MGGQLGLLGHMGPSTVARGTVAPPVLQGLLGIRLEVLGAK